LIRLTHHARESAAKRGVDIADLVTTVSEPVVTMPGKHPRQKIVHGVKFGVVVEERGEDLFVVTFFSLASIRAEATKPRRHAKNKFGVSIS